jgi:hypothetical protein
VPRLFALDQNFREPIVDALVDFLAEDAELVPIRRVDTRLSTATIDAGRRGRRWPRPHQGDRPAARPPKCGLRENPAGSPPGLDARQKAPDDAWDDMTRAAERHETTAEALYRREQLTADELSGDPLR